MKVKYSLMALFDALVVAAGVIVAALRIQPAPDIVWVLIVCFFAVDAALIVYLFAVAAEEH